MLASVEAAAIAAELIHLCQQQASPLREIFVESLRQTFHHAAARSAETLLATGGWTALHWQQLQMAQKLLAAGARSSRADSASVIELALHLGAPLGQYMADWENFLARTADLCYLENPLNLVVRYWDMFVLRANDELLKDKTGYVDVAAEFQRLVGIPLHSLLSISFGLYARAVRGSPGSTSFHNFITDLGAWFSSTTVAPETLRSYAEVMAQSADDYRTWAIEQLAAVGQVTDDFAWDYSELKIRPLVKASDGSVVVLNLQYLLERSTSGIYHFMLTDSSRQNRDKFLTFFGYVYEYYLRRLFERVVAFPGAVISLEPEKPYGAGKLTSDVSLVHGADLYLLEIVSARWTRNARIAGEIAPFLERLMEKANQLSRRLDDFVAGQFSVLGRTYLQFDRIFPVVVALEPLPNFSAGGSSSLSLGARLEQEAFTGGLFQQQRVQTIQTASAEELEILEAFSARSPTAFPQALSYRAGIDTERWGPLANTARRLNPGAPSGTDHQRRVLSDFSESLGMALFQFEGPW